MPTILWVACGKSFSVSGDECMEMNNVTGRSDGLICVYFWCTKWFYSCQDVAAKYFIFVFFLLIIFSLIQQINHYYIADTVLGPIAIEFVKIGKTSISKCKLLIVRDRQKEIVLITGWLTKYMLEWATWYWIRAWNISVNSYFAYYRYK